MGHHVAQLGLNLAVDGGNKSSACDVKLRIAWRKTGRYEWLLRRRSAESVDITNQFSLTIQAKRAPGAGFRPGTARMMASAQSTASVTCTALVPGCCSRRAFILSEVGSLLPYLIGWPFFRRWAASAVPTDPDPIIPTLILQCVTTQGREQLAVDSGGCRDLRRAPRVRFDARRDSRVC